MKRRMFRKLFNMTKGVNSEASSEKSTDNARSSSTTTDLESSPQASSDWNREATKQNLEADTIAKVENSPNPPSPEATEETTKHELDVNTEIEPECKSPPALRKTEVPSTPVSDTDPALLVEVEDPTIPSTTSPPQLTPPPSTPAPAPVKREQLWDEAYDSLRLDNPELVARYEEIISRDIKNGVAESRAPGASASVVPKNAINQTDPKVRWQQMCRLLTRWLDNPSNSEASQLQSSLRDHIRNSTGNTLPNALAWACVCYASRVLSNPKPKTEAVCLGIIHLVTKMDWYTCLPRLFIGHDTDEPKNEEQTLRKRVVNLYTAILSCGMNASILSLDFLSDSQFGTWDAITTRLREVEENLSLLNGNQMKQQLDEIMIFARKREESREERPDSPIQKYLPKPSKKLNEQLDCLGEVDPRLGLFEFEGENGFTIQELYQWTRSTKEYKSIVDWNSKTSRVLLISGIGKTTVMKAIVRHLLYKANPNQAEPNERDSNQKNSGHSDDGTSVDSKEIPWALSYYFCGRTSHGLDNSARALRSLLYTLLKQQPRMIAHLEEAQSSTGRNRFDNANDFVALSGIFFRMLKDEHFVQSYLVVDGIDECSSGDDENDLDDLLQLINASANISSKIRWIVSANANGNIRIEWELRKGKWFDHLSLSGGSQDTLSAIFRRSVDNMISELIAQRKYREDTKSEVASIIRQKSQGNTVWATIACAILRKEDNWYAVEVLKEMPQDLEELYGYARECIEKLPRQDPEFCKTVLSTMAIAHRPLHISKLASLAELPSLVDPGAIIEKCRSFLEVRDDVVKFVNPSARRNARKHLRESSALSQAHSLVTMNALESLSTSFKNATSSASGLGVDRDQRRQGGLTNSYGTIHWLMHIANVKDIASDAKTTNSVISFIENYFLLWLDTIISGSLHIDTATLMRKLESRLTENSKDNKRLLSFVRDASRVIHSHTSGSSIFHPNPNSVIFYPSESALKQAWMAKHKSWLVVAPRMAKSWGDSSPTMTGHSDWVRAIAFSPDGRHLASGSDDATVRIWDVETGAAQLTLEHDQWVRCVAFSSSGLLASGSDDRNIHIWDWSTGNLRKTFPDQHGKVMAVRFSPDGNKLAVGASKTVRVWDLSNLEEPTMKELKGHYGIVRSVDFSQNGELIVSGGDDSMAKVWNAGANEIIQTLKGHSSGVSSVVFSADGKHIVSGSDDGTVKIWDVKTWGTLNTLNGGGCVLSVAFSPDGSYFATGSDDRTIKIWDTATGELKYVMRGHKRLVRTVAFSQQGRLASGSNDSTIRLWGFEGDVGKDTDTLEEPIERGSTNFVAISPDGLHIASASGSTIYLWDGMTGQPMKKHKLSGHGHSVRSVWFSPDGKRLVSTSNDGFVRLWDVASGAALRTFRGHSDWVRFAVFSPDGRYVASASEDKTVRIWSCRESEGSEDVKVLKDHKDHVRTVAFSPDGKLLASGGDDLRVLVYDTTSLQLKFEVNGHSGSVIRIIFSQDSSRILTRSDDFKVWVWDAYTGNRVQGPIQTDGAKRYAWFDPRSPEYMLTEFGTDPSSLGSSSFFNLRALVGDRYGISADNNWITWKGRKVVPILKKYQPTASWVQGHIVAFGTKSGEVLLFRFSTEFEPPIWETGP